MSIVRYRSIAFERPLAKILSSGVTEQSFLASDGYVIERDLATDPTTVRVSHPKGLAAHDVPWSRVYDSEREDGARDEVKPTPAACMAPEAPIVELPVEAGAMSEASREALERDGVRVESPRRPPKRGWPGGKKKREHAAAKAKEPES